MTKQWKKRTTTLLAFALLTVPTLSSCSSGGKSSDSEQPEPVVITVELDKSSYSVAEDEAFFLVATTNSNRSVRWTSSDPTVASVSSSGRVLAKKAGTVTITVNAEGKEASCVVTVTAGDTNKGAYLKVSNSKVMLDMQSKNTETVTTQYVEVNDGAESVLTDKTVTYQSADETVATVSSDGVITPVSTGTTDIIVTSDGMTEYVTADVYTSAISTPQEWLKMFENTCDTESRYYLKNDVDFTGVEYDIGDLAENGDLDTCFFGAEVNGDFYSVKNVTMSGVSQSLFGTTVGITLKNISFENILFTKEAGRVSGIAHTVGQHTGHFGKQVVLESEITNVAMDLVFETSFGNGVSNLNYGMNMNNTFIRMRRGENSTVTEYPDQQTPTGYVNHETLPSSITTKAFMGVSRMAYNWGYGKSSMSNVIVYCEVANVGGVIGMGYGEFEGDNVSYTEKQMRASYDAYQIFDHNVWDVQPEYLPKFYKISK